MSAMKDLTKMAGWEGGGITEDGWDEGHATPDDDLSRGPSPSLPSEVDDYGKEKTASDPLKRQAIGCPDNLPDGSPGCDLWEENTEKYKDVVKDKHRKADSPVNPEDFINSKTKAIAKRSLGILKQIKPEYGEQDIHSNVGGFIKLLFRYQGNWSAGQSLHLFFGNDLSMGDGLGTGDRLDRPAKQVAAGLNEAEAVAVGVLLLRSVRRPSVARYFISWANKNLELAQYSTEESSSVKLLKPAQIFEQEVADFAQDAKNVLRRLGGGKEEAMEFCGLLAENVNWRGLEVGSSEADMPENTSSLVGQISQELDYGLESVGEFITALLRAAGLKRLATYVKRETLREFKSSYQDHGVRAARRERMSKNKDAAWDSALTSEEGIFAEGCPDNLDKEECGEWEANTEKYKDVVKDKHRQAALTLNKKDKTVIRAFSEKESGESKHLSTDGKTLDGSWMGGNKIAEWVGGKIQINDLGSRAAQTVQRSLKKEAPANWFKKAAKPSSKDKAEAKKIFDKLNDKAVMGEWDDVEELEDAFNRGDVPIKTLREIGSGKHDFKAASDPLSALERMARKQMLLPKALRSKIPKLYSQDDNPDPTVWVKFFNAYGHGTWLITEFDGRDQMFGLADLGHPELGYISLSELESLEKMPGLQQIERDSSFRPKPLSEAIKKEHINYRMASKTAARSLKEIAREIRQDWKKVNFAAEPYLDAMGTLNSVQDNYYDDSGQSIVAYFLSNARAWRGPVAKQIKKELKTMIPRYGSLDPMLSLEARLADVNKTAARPLNEIAREIHQDWKKVYFGAVPYLDAMGTLRSINDDYGQDSGQSIVAYFLSNARGWRGPVAKQIKKELKSMLSRRGSDDPLFALEMMAEGCPDNLDDGECQEWEANTEKYKDVVKDQHREAKKNLRILKRNVERLLDDEMVEPRWTDYSGRGMFGKYSALAFACPVHPNDSTGKKLQKWGFSYDNLGMDYIYYLRQTKEASGKTAAHHQDGKDWYVDTAFINASRGFYPRSELKHMGFGEFELVTPDGTLQFDRMRGKNFEGMSGRSHKLYDDAKGKVVAKAIQYAERSKQSVKMSNDPLLALKGKTAARAEVQVLDGDTRSVEWEGTVAQLIKDNDGDDEVKKVVAKLKKGQEHAFGGGAGAHIIIRRV